MGRTAIAISRDELDGRTVVHVRGEVDLDTSPDLRSKLHTAIEASQGDVLVDLSDVPFMDSTGLGVLLGAQRRLREEGRSLELLLAAPAVIKLFKITGLDHVFVIRGAGRGR